MTKFWLDIMLDGWIDDGKQIDFSYLFFWNLNVIFMKSASWMRLSFRLSNQEVNLAHLQYNDLYMSL